MENDVNNAQVITEQGPVQAQTVQGVSQVATGTGDTSQVAADNQLNTADGQQIQTTQEEQHVPYTRFKEVNEKAKAAQDELANMRLQMQIMQANQPQAKTPEQQNMFDQICQEKGYNDEYLTKAQQAEVTQEVVTRQISGIQAQMQRQAFVSQHPDYADVVGTTNPYTGQFQVAAPLARQLQKNPMLLQALQSSPQRDILAYQIAISDPEYIASKTQSQAHVAEQVLTQQKATMQSIGNVPGQGNLDKMAMIKNMSPSEFEAYKNGVTSKAL